MSNRTSISHHKSALTALIEVSERLEQLLETITEKDLEEVRLTKAAFKANVHYLRRKYAQWYQPLEKEVFVRVAHCIDA